MCLEKNIFQRQSINRISHMNLPGIEPGPLMRSRGLTAWAVGNKNRFDFLIRILESEICVNSAYRFRSYGTENTRCSLWGLSFSQWCCWRSQSCGMWRCVVRPVVDVISKGHSAFIFRVKNCKNKMKKLRELLTKRHNGTSQQTRMFGTPCWLQREIG